MEHFYFEGYVGRSAWLIIIPIMLLVVGAILFVTRRKPKKSIGFAIVFTVTLIAIAVCATTLEGSCRFSIHTRRPKVSSYPKNIMTSLNAYYIDSDNLSDVNTNESYCLIEKAEDANSINLTIFWDTWGTQKVTIPSEQVKVDSITSSIKLYFPLTENEDLRNLNLSKRELESCVITLTQEQFEKWQGQ
ncbi:MAG: hypothetical protein ACOX0Z_03210 [Candidatus Nanosyncoccaceae bacterium]|jgi:hypothetical protein